MQIEIANYTKKVRGALVLDRINLRLESGRIYGFIGRNGSGKTMLLRGISGLIRPTEGQIILDGEKVLHKDCDFPPSMGLLLEKPNFLGYLSGLENLNMLAEIKKEVTEEEICSLMEQFHLEPHSKKPFSKYSQGMKQKIGIIQAIMENPDLIILDEPFNALDEESVQILRDILLARVAKGKLILLTSHHKEDIDALCDVVYTIAGGSITNKVDCIKNETAIPLL